MAQHGLIAVSSSPAPAAAGRAAAGAGGTSPPSARTSASCAGWSASDALDVARARRRAPARRSPRGAARSASANSRDRRGAGPSPSWAPYAAVAAGRCRRASERPPDEARPRAPRASAAMPRRRGPRRRSPSPAPAGRRAGRSPGQRRRCRSGARPRVGEPGAQVVRAGAPRGESVAPRSRHARVEPGRGRREAGIRLQARSRRRADLGAPTGRRRGRIQRCRCSLAATSAACRSAGGRPGRRSDAPGAAAPRSLPPAECRRRPSARSLGRPVAATKSSSGTSKISGRKVSRVSRHRATVSRMPTPVADGARLGQPQTRRRARSASAPSASSAAPG